MQRSGTFGAAPHTHAKLLSDYHEPRFRRLADDQAPQAGAVCEQRSHSHGIVTDPQLAPNLLNVGGERRGSDRPY
jgi:hypothetical protein